MTTTINQKVASPFGNIVNDQTDTVESSVKTLYPVDYIPHCLFSTDGVNVYGRSTATPAKVYRVPVGSNVGVAGANACADGTLNAIAVTDTPGLLFASVGGSGATTGYLERSTDYGDNWTRVLQLGSGGGGAIQTVRLLSDRSFCDVTISGVRTFFVAEYNVNGSRVNGSTNDRVSLWKSVDLGLTWTEEAYWNADGSNQNIKHFHAIKKDPYTNRLYILVGDENVACGMISWDGVTPLQSNTKLSAMTQSAGVIVISGKQRYRACDLQFDSQYIYYVSDGPVGSGAYYDSSVEVGWWKCAKNLAASSFVRIGASILERFASDANIGGFYGATTSSGSLVWVDSAPASAVAGDTNFSVYHTNVERSKEARVGKVQMSSSPNATPGQVCVAGDYVYLGISGYGLDKTATCTTVCKVSEIDFVAPRPDTLHPVWWIDPTTGSDSNDGVLPTTPFLTLTYALQGSRLTQGGRLQYPAVYKADEGAHTGTTAFNTTGADTTEYVTIAGMGAMNTRIFQGGTNAYFIKLTGLPIELQDIWIGSNYLVSGVALFNPNGANVAPVWRSIRSITGNNNGYAQITIFATQGAGYTGTFKSYDSVHVSYYAGTNGLWDDANSAAIKNWYAERTVFIGAKHSVRLLADASTFSWKDCDFIDYSSTGTSVAIPSTAAALPTGRRGRFASRSSVAQLLYAGALTPSNNYVDCQSNRTLAPAAFFDYTSEVVNYEGLLDDMLRNPVNALEWMAG